MGKIYSVSGNKYVPIDSFIKTKDDVKFKVLKDDKYNIKDEEISMKTHLNNNKVNCNISMSMLSAILNAPFVEEKKEKVEEFKNKQEEVIIDKIDEVDEIKDKNRKNKNFR